jgi:ribonucleoside-diphosphate reductase alpha subunit
MVSKHPAYGELAGRIVASNLQKQVRAKWPRFRDLAKALATYVHPTTRQPAPLMDPKLYETAVLPNVDRIEAALRPERDMKFGYFGFKTLERSYLLRMNGEVAETPQDLYMRVALGIHWDDIEAALETYEALSCHYMTHATPTMFNAGTPNPQMSSCFLLEMKEDSIEGIYDTLKQCACISKYAGGIGLSVHNIRASRSYIRGTNGASNGLVPMLRVFNDTAQYVDQGGGKRKGSFAIYLEPWHADVFEFLDLKKNHGKEELRARDLFYGMWVPDLFMERVSRDEDWSLFCPNEAPGLADVYGDEFKALYTKYEAAGLARRTVPARKLWFNILDSQIETGTPYLMYKDACNAKSNQKNLGTIKRGNLCTEIVEYTSPEEIAVCNLASIALPKFVKVEKDRWTEAVAAMERRGALEFPELAELFDFEALQHYVRIAVRNLNRVIDRNLYPAEVPETKNSNLKHRPIGLGVQGLADVFKLLRMPFDSSAARSMNTAIFEAMYFAAVDESINEARRDGPYSSYAGSPASRGQLQFDLWGVQPSKAWDWAGLKERLAAHGLRNSLLVAPMPTASTAQIMGNTEGIEPTTYNLYTRRVLAGEFMVADKYMVQDLQAMDLWHEDMRSALLAQRGSLQGLTRIPKALRERYKTVFEMSMKTLIDHAADRGPYVCQSQSLNLYRRNPTTASLSSMHFYGWRAGLKTGQYYLHTQPDVTADASLAQDVETRLASVHALQVPEHPDNNDSPVVRSYVAKRQAPASFAGGKSSGALGRSGSEERAEPSSKPSFDGAACVPGCDSCGS